MNFQYDPEEIHDFYREISSVSPEFTPHKYSDLEEHYGEEFFQEREEDFPIPRFFIKCNQKIGRFRP